jgi:hypothetical protein
MFKKITIVLSFTAVTIANSFSLRSHQVAIEFRELEENDGYPSFAPTESPSIEYPVDEATMIPTNDTDTTSFSTYSKPGISGLEFAVGFLIIAISFLVFACVVAAIKKNTSCYEDHVIGTDLIGDFDDDASDDTEDSSHANGISLSGIKRDKSVLLSGRSRSTSCGGTRKNGKGAEFVKLRHFEDSSTTSLKYPQEVINKPDTCYHP